MIKVTLKSFDLHTAQMDMKTEIFRVLNFLHSEKDGYVVVCSRLFERKRLVHRIVDSGSGRSSLETVIDGVGDIVVMKVSNLRVISSSTDDEDFRHMKNLQTLLFSKEIV